MREKPDIQRQAFERENTLGARQINVDGTHEQLREYLRDRYRQTIILEPEGALADALAFHGINRPDVYPNILECAGETLIEAYVSDYYTGWHTNLPPVANTGSFREIGNALEDELVSSPQNALQFVEKYIGPLPKHIERIPSINPTQSRHNNPYEVSGYGKDTRFRDEPLQYLMPDYRNYHQDQCQYRAEEIHRHIMCAATDKQYERFAVDVAADNIWQVRLHRYKRDYTRRFNDLFRRHIALPRTTVMQRNAQAPASFEHDKDEDFILPCDTITRDLPVDGLLELRARLEALLEDHRALMLEVFDLYMHYNADHDGKGEFIDHSDLEEDWDRPDGVMVAIHKMPKPPK